MAVLFLIILKKYVPEAYVLSIFIGTIIVPEEDGKTVFDNIVFPVIDTKSILNCSESS